MSSKLEQYEIRFAQLKREEEEKKKAYDQYIYNLRMYVRDYNNIIETAGLQDTYPLLDENADKAQLKKIYDTIQANKKSLEEKIEVLLGLREAPKTQTSQPQSQPQPQSQVQIQQEQPSDFSGYNSIFEEGMDFDGIGLEERPSILDEDI